MIVAVAFLKGPSDCKKNTKTYYFSFVLVLSFGPMIGIQTISADNGDPPRMGGFAPKQL